MTVICKVYDSFMTERECLQSDLNKRLYSVNYKY